MSTKHHGLFDGPAPRFRAVPASVPFLDVLADAMVEALYRADDPFALSDALVLLPNRRATRGLVDAFAARLGGAALLPALRPLGDPQIDDDVEVWGADPIAIDAPPAIEKTRRRLELAALIRARDAASGGVEDPARAIALADELAKLLDSAATVDEVRWDLLPNLADEADLAAHWAKSADFLKIVADYWPQRLKLDGLSDPGARGAMLRRQLALLWESNPPQRPVIIAGSTGSVSTTRDLMRVVSRLPRGVVVFPGLDVDLDDGAWDAVADQHPQFALRQTLQTLGVARSEIAPLGDEKKLGHARRVLMREALAPAEKTADWLQRLKLAGGADFVAAGADGISLIAAATEDEEATSIALLLREALETPERTAALVTPDVGLARRVEAKLARWGVQPVVSHGRPLRETPPGALIALLCDLARDPTEPVALAALLKHPLSKLGSEAARVILEHAALRGARRHESFAELSVLAGKPLAQALVADIEEALAPLMRFMAASASTLAAFADAVTETAERVGVAREVWRGVDGESAASLLQEAIAHGADLQNMRTGHAPRALLKLMDGRETPPPRGGDPRVAIWGPLEARLQRRDLMILGGLNEGVWPASPGDDPFLSRPMRAALGLPSLEARIGLAAHDFAQLVSAPNVVLTRSLKREGAPTIASRWLWRLETLTRGAGAELQRLQAPLHWARALDAPVASRTTRIPRPKPPPANRLKRISVTQVETLIRDPYAVYARRILGLEVLRPVGAPCGPRERGDAVHKAIEVFADGDDPADLLKLLDEQLRVYGVPAERRVAERARMARSVDVFLDWLRARRALGHTIYAEMKGELKLAAGVVLSAKADRIEIGPHGAAILDFKTGAPASDAQVSSGLAPQLPLEAAMLARGTFEGVPKARVSELIYWRFGGADPAPRSVEFKNGSAHEAGENVLLELEKLLKRYAEKDQAFLSKPRVQFLKPYDDYDHLARRKEWADAEGDE